MSKLLYCGLAALSAGLFAGVALAEGPPATNIVLGVSGTSPSTFGQSLTLTATVTPSAATGRVTFYDGATVVGGGALKSGAASIATSLLPSGVNNLTAYYAGDANDAASVSAVVARTVNAIAAVTLTQATGSPFTAAVSAPFAVAVGDFNGDGQQDLAIANEGGSSVTVLLGNGTGGFSAAPGSPFPVGAQPEDVAVGDFNGDGIPDIVTANQGSNNVTVLLGNGTGGFSAAAGSPFAAGGGPEGVAVGDFNRDGISDIATANFSTGNVTVLLGNGAGGFTAAAGSPFAAGSDPRKVAIADFNRDGNPDLVTANQSSGNVTVLLGNGAGGFTAATGSPFTVGSSPEGVAVGDFNADGIPDIVTANQSSGNVTVLLGNGTGGFSAAAGSPFAVGVNPESVAVGDFNGDGIADLVAANNNGVSGSVTILLGNGTGGFSASARSPLFVGQNPLSVVVGEFNGDGRADIAVANENNSGVAVLLGSSTAPVITTTTTLTSSANPATFSQKVTFTATVTPATTPGAITFKDGSATLTTSALTDGVATYVEDALSAGSHSITAVYPGDGNDATSTSAAVNQAIGIATSVLAVGASANPSAVGQSVTLFAAITPTLATGSVTFLDGSTTLGTATLNLGTATLAVPNFTAGTHALTASYAGDGNDTAVTSPTLSQVVYQPATTTTMSLTSGLNPANLGQNVTLTAAVTPASATGNATFYDGTTVLGTKALAGGQATLTTNLLPSGVRSLKAYVGTGSVYASSTSTLAQTVKALPASGFAPAVSSPGSSAYNIAVADFNGDGKADFATTNFTAVQVYLGNGDGTFQAPLSYSIGTAIESLYVAVGDFNGDGKTDLVATSYENDSNSGRGSVSVLLGNGDGTFQTAVAYAVGADNVNLGYTFGVAVADFNGDGKADLAVGGLFTGSLSILLGNGDGTFQPAANYSVGSSETIGVVAEDFNGDGKPDLAISGFFGNSEGVNILLGNGDGTFQAPVTYAAGTFGYLLATGDFNGDGKPDLAVGGTTGSISVLLGKGDGTFQAAVHYAVSGDPYTIVTGDFNGDGKADLAAPSYLGNNLVSVLLGNGDGTFQTVVTYGGTGNDAFGIAAGDFNGDSRTDLVIGQLNGSGINVLLGIPSNLTGTTTTLTSSLNPSGAGQAVTFTAAVSPSNATGTVTFRDGATVLCTNAVSASTSTANATCSTTTLTGGSHTITAAYNGDQTYAPSIASALTQTVIVLTPTISLAPSSANAGGPAFTLTVNGTNFVSGATVEWGTTALTTTFVSGTQLTAAVGAAQIAAAGPVSVTVVNPGPATSNTATFTVNSSTVTTTMLISSPSPSTFGQAITLTATVAPPAATGKVTFYEGSTVLGIGTVSSGVARLTTGLLPSGRGTLKAYYGGDASHPPSTSGPAVQTVNTNPSGTLTAASGSPFATAASPWFITKGDFNGDGVQDLVVVSHASPGTISILLGSGSGGFNPATGSPFPVGANPWAAAVGDFNGDGLTDIAVANGGDNNVTILLGNGSGGFTAASGSPFAVGTDPWSIAVADYNGDGIADLAVANAGAGNVTVLLGDGSGAFSAATGSPFGAGTAPQSITAGDFNGDGIPDLAVANQVSNNVTVLLGNGSGGFTAVPGSPFTTGAGSISVMTADFNADGNLDLVIANRKDNNVTVLLGDGSGGFSPSSGSPFAAGSEPYSIAVGDLNGDGIPDLATANYLGDTTTFGNMLTVLLGDGSGSFGPAAGTSFVVGTGPSSAVMGDFNGDGRADVAAAMAGGGNNVTVLLGGVAATGSLLSTTSPASIAVGTAVPLTLTVSDSVTAFNAATGTAKFYDGETLLGTAAQTASPYTLSATGLSVGSHSFTATYSGDARSAGSAGSAVNITVTGSVTTPTVSSLAPSSANAGAPAFTLTVNGTNFVSGATVEWGTTALTTTFVSATQLTAAVGTAQLATAGPVSVTVVNAGPVRSAAATFTVNVSGTTTTLTSSANPSTFGQVVTLTATVAPAGAAGKVTFYEGASVLGIGTVSSGVAKLKTGLLPSGRGALKAYYAGDVIYFPSSTGPVAQTVNAIPSATLVQAAVSPIAVGTGPTATAVGDFNGDGIQDVAIANNGSGNVTILLGNGAGGFSAAMGSPFAAGTKPLSVAVGDFNGDGLEDLAVVNAGSANVTVLLGNGTGGFSAAQGSPFAVGTNPVRVAVGDFNADGIQDLAVANSGSNNVTILLGNGSGDFTAATGSPIAAGTNPVTAAVADFNGDGIPDLAVSNIGSNDVTVLLGNGSGGFSPASGSPVAVGMNPYALAVGDFNADGIPDIAAANAGSNNVTVLLGNGSGGFSAASGSPFAAGTFPAFIGLGDFNGDGIPDIATANVTSNDVTILLGNGSGGFSAASGSPFAAGTGPSSVAVGDFNGDGRTDLVTANYAAGDGNTITVLLGASVAISSLAPSAVTAGGPAFTLTVNGQGFAASSVVQWNGAPLATTVANATQLTASVPATLIASAGPVSITVTNPGGATSPPLTFPISPTPAVTSVSPNSISANSAATAVTITGSNFVAGDTVSFTPPGGTATLITPDQIQAAQITATIPAALLTTAGSAKIAIQNGAGTLSSQLPFTVVAAGATPTISGLSPYSATMGGPAFTLTVLGANFVANSTVQWGGTALTTTLVSSTQLAASVSATQIAATGAVNVTVANGGPLTSAPSPFTILAPTSQTWTQLTPAGGPPSAREGAGAVYDPAAAQMIVFGGLANAGYVNDTWSLNTTTNQWSQLAPAGTAPVGRRGVSAVYDSANSIVTVFGGQESGGCANDVWTLSNANGSAGTPMWAQLSPAGTAPAPRSFGSAVYDSASNRMIVFGGNTCSLTTLYNDVWVLANANGVGGTPAWAQLAPAGTLPTERNGASAVYDPGSNELIIFGGANGSADVNDVWILSHANGIGGTPAWTQVTPASGAIPARAFHAAVYDAASNRMTVFGGFNSGAGGLSDTWVLTNANNSASGTPTWVQLAPSGTIPPARAAQTAILDSTANRMVVFGGFDFGVSDFVNLNDTWVLSDANGLAPSISVLTPNTAVAGSGPLTLGVNGQGFASGAVVNWNGAALPTTVLTSQQLTAAVGASLTATAGTASVTIVNPDGTTSTAFTFTITSPPPPPVQPLTITSGAPPSGTVNAAYAGFTFTGSGGSGTNSWTASGVAGLTVDPATGILSGTPTSAGNFTLGVTLTNGGSSISQNYSLTIAAAPLSITTSALPNGIENQAYSAQLAGSGGSGSYQWAISGIAGLTVNAASGAIGGSPTVGGNLTLNVTLSDASNASATPATKAFTVAITFTPLSIKSSGALGGFASGAAVSATFAATGGNAAYTWSATGMPASLTLNASTGQLGGTAPANPGNYSFALTVSDTEKPAASASTTVTLSVLGITTSTTLPSGSTATPYSLNFTAAGGTPPYTFTAAGVPAGLTLASSGFLSGTPTNTGTTSFTVQVADANGLAVAGTFSLTVASGVQPIQVTGASLPDGSATASYSQTLEAQDGQPTYKWVVLGGTLPAGLTLSSAGTISGTPTMPGLSTFTARATDAAGGFAAGVFTINVAPAPLQVTAAALPNGMAGLPYGAQPINATGGFAPYTFALTQGSVPAPLTFTNGQINSGVPASAGTSSFTVTVTDAQGNTASQAFTLVIEVTHPDLILSQGAVGFSIATNTAALPAAANVTVGSSVANSLGFNFNVNPAAPWLDVTANGSTPGTVSIALDPVNASQLGKGTYQTSVVVSCGPLSGCSGSHNIAVTLTVTAPAPQLTLGTGLLSFSATGNSAQTLAQPLNLQNSGGGVVTIQSVTAADAWVKFDAATVPPPAMALAAGQTLQVNVFADPTVLSGPGYYQSTITVTSDAGTATVPVTLLIAANATMTLNPAGSQFNTVAGNAPGLSNGSFAVSVSGSSTVNWTAAVLSTTPAATWLTLNTPSGSSTAAQPGTIGYTINSAAAGLAAQPYYAIIEVRATGGSVSDPVQDYQVVLNVTAAGNIAAPNPDPQGLIFISTGPGTLPAQVVTVGSSSAGVSYAATSDSPAWLSVSPGSGTTSAGAPAQSSVTVNAASLGNGVYRGGVNYAIAGQVRTVNVTLIVAAPAASAAISGVSGKVSAPGCTATQLIPTQTGGVNNFSTTTAWPTPLEITVVDNCGKAVTSGQVVATFSNDDPPLVMPVVGGSAGVYSGTWTPKTSGSQVTITAQATAAGFKPASVLITGEVTRGGAPVLNAGGTLNAFVPVLGGPLAPGMIVQIYGANLASQTAVSAEIPLTTALNHTSVIIGGVAAPLYFVSPGQINAQVPFELTAGSQYQVVVNANGQYSTANPIQLAGDAPGIAAYASGGIIAEHADGTLVTETAPAAPNEYVVFFVSGMGATDNAVASGQPSPGSPGLARPTDAPVLTLNGANVPIAFAGLTPTLVGLYQVNFQVPGNAPNGDLQLVLTQSGGQSNSTILPVHN